MMKTILLVTNIPNPYRIPLFNELHKQCEQESMRLHVIFAARSYQRRMFQINMEDCLFSYNVLDSEAITHANNNEKTFFSYNGLSGFIKRIKPSTIIVSGFSAAATRVYLLSYIHKFNYIIWSGSIEKKGRNDNPLRILQRKLIVKKASAYIAYGSLAKKYLEKLGAKKENVFIGINTVDTSFFAQKTFEEKKKLDSGTSIKHLTYVGYLVPRKNVKLLLEIILKLSKTRNDFVLDVIGDGESRSDLELFIKQNRLESHVHFHGFKQKEELPAYLAKSSGFLFQTDFDIWGLTLNEAMAAGLTCISSTNAGASYDLIKEGETGFMLNYELVSKVEERINWMLDNPDQSKNIGAKAKKYVEEKANLTMSARGFLEAINKSN